MRHLALVSLFFTLLMPSKGQASTNKATLQLVLKQATAEKKRLDEELEKCQSDLKIATAAIEEEKAKGLDEGQKAATLLEEQKKLVKDQEKINEDLRVQIQEVEEAATPNKKLTSMTELPLHVKVRVHTGRYDREGKDITEGFRFQRRNLEKIAESALGQMLGLSQLQGHHDKEGFVNLEQVTLVIVEFVHKILEGGNMAAYEISQWPPEKLAAMNEDLKAYCLTYDIAKGLMPYFGIPASIIPLSSTLHLGHLQIDFVPLPGGKVEMATLVLTIEQSILFSDLIEAKDQRLGKSRDPKDPVLVRNTKFRAAIAAINEYMKVQLPNERLVRAMTFDEWCEAASVCEKNIYHARAEITYKTTSSDIENLGVFMQTSYKHVGSLDPNACGLYDIIGNVPQFAELRDKYETKLILCGGNFCDGLSMLTKCPFCKEDKESIGAIRLVRDIEQ